MRMRLTALLLLFTTAASAQTTTTRTDRLVIASPPARSSETACLWRDASTGMVAAGACPTGTVTSVGLSLPGIFSVSGSPVTGAGTLTASLVSQTQNLVWASPNGSSGAPTFRVLVDGDIPDNLTLGTVSGSPTFSGAATFSAAGTALSVTNNAAFGGIASSLVPSLTDTYNLGSALRLWNEGFVSQLNAVIYAEQTATLFGGWSVIGKNAGTFAAAVGAADTSINFGKAMTNGHFIVVRAHDTSGTVRAEHMQITGTTGCTTCTVTRGLNTGGTGYAFTQGTSYLVSGTTGDGRIELRAYSTPQISILTQGATYNAQTEHVRIGYLDGAAGMGATTGKVGIVIGDASQYLRYYDGVLTIAGNGSGITSIHGGNIQTDTITATQIAANAITASEIAADAVTAAKIAATAIDGKTITGATIRTASSGARVEMNSSNLRAIDSGGNTLLTLDGTGIAVTADTGSSLSDRAAYRFLNTLTGTGATATGTYNHVSGQVSYLSVANTVLNSTNNRATTEVWAGVSGNSATFASLLLRGVSPAESSGGASAYVRLAPVVGIGIGSDTPRSGSTLDVAGNILPHTSATHTLGTSTYGWASLYLTDRVYNNGTTGWGLKWNATYTNHEFSHDVQAPGLMLNNWQAAPAGARVVCTGATSAGADNWIYFGVDGTQCNSSSLRYKTRVEPAAFDWGRLLDLRPVTFEYRTLPGVAQFGLVAEEVAALGLEPLVVRTASGDIESVAYDKVALYLIPVARAQRDRLDALERRLSALEASR